MNKVFSIGGKVADEAKEKHLEFIENAKNAFISYFGKKREGLICSTLDYADYVWLDVDALQCDESLRRKEINNSQFVNFLKEHKTMSHMDNKQIDSIINHIVLDMFAEDLRSDACAMLLGNSNGKFDDICILPTGLSNRVYVHELLHLMSSKLVEDCKIFDNIFHIDKIGFSSTGTDQGDFFNEVFTDYLAFDIDKYMKKNKLTLFGKENKENYYPNVYSRYFPLISNLFNKCKKPLFNSFFGDDFTAMYKAVGKNNFNNLLSAFDKLFKYDKEKNFKLKDVLNFVNDANSLKNKNALSSIYTLDEIDKFYELVNNVIDITQDCLDTYSKTETVYTIN